jgi:PAS domain S-box-containing protein
LGYYFGQPDHFDSDDLSWASEILGPRPLFRDGSEGQLLTDMQGMISRADSAAAALLGTKARFLPGKPLAFFFREQDRRGFYHRLGLLGRGWATTAQRRVRPHAQPARRRQLLLVGGIVHDSNGVPAGIRWLLRDITRRRDTLRALHAARAFSTGLLDAAQAIVLVLDRSGCITQANDYLGTVTGYLPSEVRAQDWCEVLIAEPERPEARRILGAAAASGTSRSGALRVRTRTQAERMVVWSARLLTKVSRSESYLLVGHDVTDLVHAQQMALQAERLATIGRTIAGLAHEGRNALQRMQATLSMLTSRVEYDRRALELIERMQRAQDDLHRLFEDVRNYAGPIQLAPEFIDVGAAVSDAWGELKSEGIELVAEVVERVPDCVADPYRMRQVFRNLLENAVAVTRPPAPVVFRCRTAEIEGAPAVCVTIRDHGPGFGPEQFEKAFEPFYTTKTRGTGLGLSICRRIVEAHGGRIALANAPGGGAEVSVYLPLRLRLSAWPGAESEG